VVNNSKSISTLTCLVWIAVLSTTYFLFLGHNHLFDWDEINFAECAREMLATGNYLTAQIDFEPFHEKPPFFIWLQAAGMSIFGVSEFAARLPNALFGFITLLSLFLIGRKHKNNLFGLIWVLLYYCSILPHFYFKSGIIDPVFNYFIFLSIYLLIEGVEQNKKAKLEQDKASLHQLNKPKLNWFFFSGLASAFAVLTKGPVGFLLLLLTVGVYFLVNRFKAFPNWRQCFLFLVTLLIPIAIWLGLDVLFNGYEKTIAFIQYQIELFSKPVAGHQQPFYYHFLVVLLGCFPMSFLALPKLFKNPFTNEDYLAKWQFILIFVVLILFSIVSTKIVHYSSLAYLPLSYFAALYCQSLLSEKQIKKWLCNSIIIFGITLGLLVSLLPIVGLHKGFLIELLKKDVLTAASLQTNVIWSGWEYMIGIFYIVIILFAVYQLKQSKVLSALKLFCLSTLFLLLAANIFIVPKIEQYSQGPAITFYKNLQNRGVYVDTYGFKSYAHLYYANQMPKHSNQYRSMQWLTNGKIDKPVYLVSKTNNTDLDKHPNFELVKVDGVFRIYRRGL